jgi:hypothetical protein
MSPLEKLFRLETEFHRRLRTQAPGTADADHVHACFATQTGYENLLRSVGPVAAEDIERLRVRLALGGDTRDILAACDSLHQLLGIGLSDDQAVHASLCRHA